VAMILKQTIYTTNMKKKKLIITPTWVTRETPSGPFIATQNYHREDITEENLLEAKSLGYELVYEDDKPEKKSNPLLPF